MPDGDEVVLLPAAAELVPGRPIVGATLRVRSLEILRRSLRHVARARHDGDSTLLPPSAAHGIFLRFVGL